MRIAPSIVTIVALAAIVAACHPREHSERAGRQEQYGQGGQMEERHGHGGLRRICADDIAKYCQNADKKKRCLRDNIDKLGADCKAAVEAAHGRKRDNDGSANSGDKDD